MTMMSINTRNSQPGDKDSMIWAFQDAARPQDGAKSLQEATTSATAHWWCAYTRTRVRKPANPQTRKAAKVQRSIRIRNTKGYI